MNADDLQRVRDYYDNNSTADEIANAELVYIDPRDPEYTEYARTHNAVAGALIDYCATLDYQRPNFSERCAVADRVWQELHPGSKYGTTDWRAEGILK
jgi:hypothetical protein